MMEPSGNNRVLDNYINSTILRSGAKYDSSSREYRAVLFAAKGAIENLRKYFPLDSAKVNSLVRILPDEHTYYTPLHYALINKQWKVAAYLLNQGCDWSLKSIRNRIVGKSSIEIIANIKDGLKDVLEALILFDEPINIDVLFLLISFPICMSKEEERYFGMQACVTPFQKKLPKMRPFL